MARQSHAEELEARRRTRITVALWSGGIVVAAVVFIVLAKLVSNGTPAPGPASGTSPAPAALVAKLASLPASLFTTVGAGSTSPLPTPLSAPALSLNGKPEVVYIGAEYCPYCATERWPMVIALLRFGLFSNLQETHSSTSDVYPNTQTFSFHGATYTSQYLTFSPSETESNIPSGDGYAPLDTLTASEQSILNTYDTPPYTSTKGGIPFIDFGGKYLISNATYSPSVLQGQSYDQIAAALLTPTSAISQGAIGTANAITAAICSVTNDQPMSVCKNSTIQSLQQKIASQ